VVLLGACNQAARGRRQKSRAAVSCCAESGRVNRRFEFQKRRQLFIRVHNETLSIVAMCVCNPDRSHDGVNFRGAPRFDATGAIFTRLFGGFVPDFPHYISGKEFKK
jgi:hypothetical protein